jgi:5-oxoprolinase (ATP-hydrolysing)
MFMMSSGGLTAADMFQGKDALLSGPAGGVVGMVETARLAGFNQVIGFDMGGTSTDVAHYDGEYERAFDTEVAGVRVRAPMMRIHTVAAGGGSILHYEDGRFQAGPDSAGANPGPACYRRGGPLAVTDANLMLGKLQPDFFPSIFGPNQDQPLDRAVVEQKFRALAGEFGKHLAAEIGDHFLDGRERGFGERLQKRLLARGRDDGEPDAVGGKQAGEGVDQHRLHTECIGDEAGMLSSRTAKAIEKIAGHVITALHRDLLDGVGHVLDGDGDEAFGDGFRRAAVADLVGQRTKLFLHYFPVERLVLVRAED